MKKSLDFYVHGLGFEIDQQAGPKEDIGWVMLKRDAIFLMLNTQYELPERPESPNKLRGKHHGDTILYIGCQDIDALYSELLSKGLSPGNPLRTGYGFRAMEISDPDGYKTCFQWRE